MVQTSFSDLYVVAYFEYFGSPSCNDTAYSSKEEAQKVVDEINQKYPTLKHKVMDLDDFISECRDHDPQSGSEW